MVVADIVQRQIAEPGKIYLARGSTQVGLLKIGVEWRFNVDLTSGPVSAIDRVWISCFRVYLE